MGNNEEDPVGICTIHETKAARTMTKNLGVASLFVNFIIVFAQLALCAAEPPPSTVQLYFRSGPIDFGGTE